MSCMIEIQMLAIPCSLVAASIVAECLGVIKDLELHLGMKKH